MFVMVTAGHVDHGKSTLVTALSGIDPDRLPEEKARGMTIDLGFAWMTTPSGQTIGIVDVPGHERFVKNMIAGVGAIDELAARLLRAAEDLQVVTLAGRNAELLARLRKLAKSHPRQLFPLGFTTTVERVMSAADLVITKPGGLTVSECLALGKPMLLVSPIPGQEERNADYLLEAGAALKAADAATLEFKLGRLIADPARLRAMGDAAHGIARPHAAKDVIALCSRP